MTFLNDIITSALRDHNVPQVGNAGSSSLAEALRSLLAPRSTQAGTAPDETHTEPDTLQQLLARFQQSGYADILRSWIGTGENQLIEPHQLDRALGPDKVDELSRETGVPRPNLLEELARLLPTVIDRLTPEGRLPEVASTPARA